MFTAQQIWNIHEWKIGNCGLFIEAISHEAIAWCEIIFGYYALKKGMQMNEELLLWIEF